MPKHTAKASAARTIYRDAFAATARLLCRGGATDAELATAFGVDVRTVHRWKASHPDFAAALAGGKAHADEQVERSLYERALGYSHKAVKILTVADGNNQGSHVEQVEYLEQYPPDTVACIFWLKNRKPKEWRDKQDIEVSGGDDLAAQLLAARKRVGR